MVRKINNNEKKSEKKHRDISEKANYGWYVKNLIVAFTIVGLIGLGGLILGFFIGGFIGLILLIAGIIIVVIFLWPGIGLTIMNITIGKEFNLDKSMKALKKIESPQILDVGCGTGRTAIQIAKLINNEGHLYGIDLYLKHAIDGNALETVQKNAKIEGVAKKTTFRFGSATEIPYEDEKFDIVNVSSVLHELHDPGDRVKALQEIYRVLKTEGQLYMSEWNRNSVQLIAYTGVFCFVFKKWSYWKDLLENNKFHRIQVYQDRGFAIFAAQK
ncbi:MAG: methyltransferase domain-containing protein [Candidatus Lokiarchaeota archaeon]|nr:methyltransferase domain-containing protein [Candidatus Lokiarchaeota archaeon]